MKEKEAIRYYSDNVRDYSTRIVETHKDLLLVDNFILKNSFVDELQKFQKISNINGDPFATESLSPQNELGLNLFLDVVNFCYSNPYSHEDYTYTNKDGNLVKRSTGLKTAMSESGVNWGNTKEVAKISREDWAKIIQLDKNKDFYLGQDRGKRIAEFAGKLAQSGFKNVADFIAFAEFDTEILLPILDKSGYFDDKFQKRSQLAISMMNGVLKRRFNKEFSGLENLTIMADYRLPQVMYNFGAIKLSEGLLEKLARQEVIESDSREELALRAASVVIGEKVANILGIKECEVDALLWTLSQKMAKSGKLTIPHMLVATDQY